MRAAIIGMGVVGKAQAGLFGEHDLVTYDVADGKPYPYRQISGCDFAVICVGTPAREDGSADLGAVIEALRILPSKPVLLRSTVPPGTTDRLQRRYPGHLIAHCPEFLHERDGGAWSASSDVPFIILGGTDEARAFFWPIIAEAKGGILHECDALTAELAKYTANLHWAARVTFVSEMAAICEAAGADWEQVRQAWLADFRLSPDYTSMDGFEPGFGGRCWPKDLSALIAASEHAGHKAQFLQAIAEANARFRP